MVPGTHPTALGLARGCLRSATRSRGPKNWARTLASVGSPAKNLSGFPGAPHHILTSLGRCTSPVTHMVPSSPRQAGAATGPSFLTPGPSCSPAPVQRRSLQSSRLVETCSDKVSPESSTCEIDKSRLIGGWGLSTPCPFTSPEKTL